MLCNDREREGLQRASPGSRGRHPERTTHLIPHPACHHARGRQNQQAIRGYSRTMEGDQPLDEEGGLAAPWSSQHQRARSRGCAKEGGAV